MRIWKFPLRVEDEQDIAMPAGASILTVQVQRGMPVLWAAVEPDSPLRPRRIFCRGTGHQMGATARLWIYIGTVQLAAGGLVFHFFDGGEQ